MRVERSAEGRCLACDMPAHTAHVSTCPYLPLEPNPQVIELGLYPDEWDRLVAACQAADAKLGEYVAGKVTAARRRRGLFDR